MTAAMAAYGLYSHIQSNRRRSMALLAGLFLLVYLLVYAGALIAEALSVNADLDTLMQLALNDLIQRGAARDDRHRALGRDRLFLPPEHDRRGDRRPRGHPRAGAAALQSPGKSLHLARHHHAEAQGDGFDALNAFATGMNERQYSITVTSGLLERLNDAEIEAVLGHELTHIRNGDVRMMVIAVIIAGAISFFAELVFPAAGFTAASAARDPSNDRRGGGAGLAILIAIGFIVVAYLLSFVIRLALSRSREFLADAGSVELTKNPDAMISALRKIEGRGELPGATSAVMEMCLDNPREGFGELFDTHPSVDARVAALVKFAGGHDPGPLVLPPAGEPAIDDEPAAAGPWGPPAQDAGDSSGTGAAEATGPSDAGTAGPWGPHGSGR